MRYLLLPVSVLFGSVLFPAQDTPAPAAGVTQKKTCKLAGRAVNEMTGEPVRKAALTLYFAGPESHSQTATSDATGRFSFENVEPGTYRLMAQKPGFLERGGKPVTLAPGQDVNDFEFKLTPQGVIAGKVVDEDGEPAAGRTSVTVFRQIGSGTRRHVTFAGQEMTNDLGEFRVANLGPGAYVVAAAPSEFRVSEMTGKKAEPEEAQVETFYPGVAEAAAASAIELKPGQEATGIQIPLRKSRVYRIEGNIAGLTPSHSARNMSISISPRNRTQGSTGFGGGLGRVKPDGTFEVMRVQPGAYYIALLLRGDARPQIIGRVAVDVGDGNVTGVVLPIIEPLQVSGTLRAEGDQKIGYDAIRVILRSAEGLPSFGRPVTVSTDGAFKIDGVPPARYNIYLYSLPDTTYVKSVRLGKQEALESGLDLTEAQGTAAIEIVLGDKPGTVEGSVQQDGKPVPATGVTLVPESARAGQRERWKFASTDQNGRFTIKGVAPGEYKLYAMQEASEYDVASDPDSLKPFEHKAVKVTVEEGATARADLSPIKPEDARPQ